jgi:hypothetical protein
MKARQIAFETTYQLRSDTIIRNYIIGFSCESFAVPATS